MIFVKADILGGKKKGQLSDVSAFLLKYKRQGLNRHRS